MENTTIRTKVLNLTLKQWSEIRVIEKDGAINVNPEQLINLIGFEGGMFLTGIFNEEERAFSNAFYELGRSKNKN